MKPDWKDAPEWAKWLAMDKNGRWYWYEKTPHNDNFVDCWSVDVNSEWENAVDKTIDWKKTLEKRPKE